MFDVCHAVLFTAACWERANLLALLCVVVSCVVVTFRCGLLGQVWYLIVSIPDFCLLPYFAIPSHTIWAFRHSSNIQCTCTAFESYQLCWFCPENYKGNLVRICLMEFLALINLTNLFQIYELLGCNL